MKTSDFETREIMISRNGKPLFAVCIGNQDTQANYVYVENGDIKFASSWLNSIQPFSLGDESHRIAKELFTIGVQAAVKSKILELKQLQAILTDLQLSECIGTLIQDNTRLLLEVKQSIEQTAPKMEDIKGAVQAAITDTVKPVALKKRRKDTEDERN
ncbi:hypothetical protein [Oscillibacter sp.]|uniref:hypothetical protein n=1 Tax=Oscillibacter sp. TaxID=1945593 RepID=UPI0028A5D17F|nr:hypothetical protein [Oscillibacter sp.]